MKNIISIIFISCFFFCCKHKPKTIDGPFDPLDTNKIISEANIQEYVSEVPDSLIPFLETKNLAYIAYACDCPNFVNLLSIDSSRAYEEQYYIQPASKNLFIPWLLMHSSNEFEFKGLITQKHGFPKDFESQNPNPPAGKVFTYWSYKIKRPFTFWGPKMYFNDDEGQPSEMASEIKVK